ncbi:unnamed protein product [Caenorhabditis auriculariae]|uniref:FHOD1 N-terminal GTPase-binding domain-containing protein n=1 Tax=Caenorhabditis auriculariae TaxID=2777116 RepID=A0A8S1GPF6_9PELO|nr:unnamed protein product [Caenorhabditis auriculariae]
MIRVVSLLDLIHFILVIWKLLRRFFLGGSSASGHVLTLRCVSTLRQATGRKFKGKTRMEEEDVFTCRIQYVNDADPFATTSSSYLEPMRPVTFNFRLHSLIGDQLTEVIRTLRAPHKVGDSALQVYKGLEGGGGEFHTYLDSDLTLADQPDELDLLKSDSYVFLIFRHY